MARHVDINKLPDSTTVFVTIGDLREFQRLGRPDVYLTEREACQYLKCSRDTLARLERGGNIKRHTLPTGAKRYRERDVAQLIQPVSEAD